MSKLETYLAAQAESAEKLAEVLKADAGSLAEVRAEALAKFKELNEGEHTDEILDQMDAYRDIAKASNLLIKETAAAESAREDRAKAAAAEMAELEDEEDLELPEVEDVVTEVVPEKVPAVEVKEKELVTASSKGKVDFAKLPSQTPAVEAKKPGRTISIAADVPGFATGAEVEGLAEIAKAFAAKMTGLSRLGAGRTAQAGIATIKKNRSKELTAKPSADQFADAAAAIKYATDLGRFGGSVEALVAAGGWCAPSENIYDLCPPASVDGLVDIPEISAPRGGIRFPQGLDFSAIYAGGFHQTEAQAIAGTVKPCIEVPCPTFTEVRLDIEGFCVQAPILTDTAYPELVENFVANVLAAHMHRINAFKLQRMVALSTANAITPVPDFGAASSALEYLELTAEWIRYQNRLGANSVMEVVLPLWARGALRADLAKKNGVELFDVTDARLEAYFMARRLRVQWVYDWQDALVSGVATDFGGATMQDTWPATVQALVYPAGTFFAPTTDVITLDSIYDSTGLSTNVFTRLFTEEGIQVAKQCWTSYVITLPVCTAGGSGAQYSPACSGGTQLPAAA